MPAFFRSPSFSILLVLGSMASLTTGASLAKSLFALFGPAGITFLRLSIGTLILLAVHRPWRLPLSRAQWKWIALYGADLGFMNLCFYLAIARMPIGLAIAIEFLGPLSVAIFFSRSKSDFFWASLAGLGIYLILPARDAPASFEGVLFALLAAAAWAGYILIGKRAGRLAPAGSITAYGMLVGSLAAAPFGFQAAEGLLSHPEFLLPALGVGILSSAIPYTFEIFALKNLDPKTFGILLSLEPAFGALAGLIFLQERLVLSQIFAITCVVAASAGSTLSARRVSKVEQAQKVASP